MGLGTSALLEDGIEIGSRYVSLVGLACLSLIVFLWMVLGEKFDKREPPVIKPGIPFIGHIIGMIRYQIKYFEMLSEKHHWPAFTLPVMGSRIYIITSPRLAQVAIKNTKSLDFDPFAFIFSRNVMAADERSMKIIEFIPEDRSQQHYMKDLHAETVAAMGLGPGLLDSNARALNSLGRNLNTINTVETKKLWDWIRTSYTVASADTLYGPDNPVSKSRDMVDSLWVFIENIGMLFMGIAPSLLARKGLKARQMYEKAFLEYYGKGLNANANAYIKARERVALRHGLTKDDLAHYEIAVMLASTTNAAPNAFWLCSFIMSDPQLTAIIRDEVKKIVSRKTINGKDTVTLDMSQLNSQCPTLVACWHETLRMVKAGASVRYVMEDMLLDNTYLLKKGSTVQIPAGVLHKSTDTWGPDAEIFDPQRFVRLEKLPREQKKAQSQSFIAFGGGKNLCPGRHLAFAEVVGYVAMLVYGFDISMADGSGTLKIIRPAFQILVIDTKWPEGDVDVNIRRREEFKDANFVFKEGSLADLASYSPE